MTPRFQESFDPVRHPLVVVVDDDPAVCNSLKFSLELEGFAVRVYGCGSEALEAGGLDECQCFVVDQTMPDLTGMEFIAKLRQRGVLVPAILILTQPSATLAARAKLAEVPIVEKPLLGNALVDRIREACERG